MAPRDQRTPCAPKADSGGDGPTGPAQAAAPLGIRMVLAVIMAFSNNYATGTSRPPTELEHTMATRFLDGRLASMMKSEDYYEITEPLREEPVDGMHVCARAVSSGREYSMVLHGFHVCISTLMIAKNFGDALLAD